LGGVKGKGEKVSGRSFLEYPLLRASPLSGDGRGLFCGKIIAQAFWIVKGPMQYRRFVLYWL